MRIKYILKAGSICLLLVIVSFAPFWVGVQTFARFLEQVEQLRFSLSAFLYYISSGGISFGGAQLIGWVLFGICFLYAVRLCLKDFSSLLKGCCLTMFAFLLFSATYTQVWYLIWSFALAILVPETWVLVAALLPLYAATLEQPISGYLIGWGPNPVIPTGPFNIAVYLALFFPPLLFLFAARNGIFSESKGASSNLS